MIEVYIYAHPPGPTFFLFHGPFHCKVNYLLSAEKKHKHKKNALESLLPSPHPQVGLPKLWFVWLFFVFFCVRSFFFLVQVPRPFQNPTQNKSSKMFVCWFFLVWGRGGELTMKLVVAGLIQIYPSQIWFIWPLRHHVSIKCILHKP